MAIGGQEAISTLDTRRNQNEADSTSSIEPLSASLSGRHPLKLVLMCVEFVQTIGWASIGGSDRHQTMSLPVTFVMMPEAIDVALLSRMSISHERTFGAGCENRTHDIVITSSEPRHSDSLTDTLSVSPPGISYPQRLTELPTVSKRLVQKLGRAPVADPERTSAQSESRLPNRASNVSLGSTAVA